MQFYRQSTAATLTVGPVLDSAGAAYTGAVIGDFSISKNGGTLNALASAATATHIHNGCYQIALTTGNTDTVGRAEITCNKSTYAMAVKELEILTAAGFDAIVTNGLFPANITQFGGVANGRVGGLSSDIIADSTSSSSGFYAATSTQYSFTVLSLPAAAIVAGGMAGDLFVITGGTGYGQSPRVVTNVTYSAGVAILTFASAWTTTPDATTTWEIRQNRLAKLDSSLRVTALDSNSVVFDSTSIPSASAIATAVWATATRTLTTYNLTSVANPFIATRDLAAVPTASAHPIQWTIVDSSGVAVSLSGKTIRCVFGLVSDAGDEDDTTDDTLTASFAYETSGSGIVVSGASNNIVTLTHDITKTATAGQFRYWLWNITDNLVLAKGRAPIEPAAKAV